MVKLSCLWQQENQEVWSAILEHPCVQNLGRGTLGLDQMARFIGQDAQYLNEFFRVLAIAAAKAPSSEWKQVLGSHSQNVLVVEDQLHHRLGPVLGISAESEPLSVTVAYTDHLLRIAWSGSFSEIIAAVLPCYWTYREIGQQLGAQGMPDNPIFRDWIETYQGAAYGQAVTEILDIADALEDSKECHIAFARSLRYEYGFWSQAYDSNYGFGWR
ncbi:MAG: thiaminase II [Sulfobacillus benefaciens]|uniref:Aminopyrimidine aminohydrolase n=1 Tax=Sulfobacillus benefaciens TaxID=453960 RepID=A0A2T2XJY2_9FIRM|nr:MAG: thiaminase II [Sulfobacillus benefaciens]